MEIHPVTLTGSVVMLRPMSEEDIGELTIAGRDENIWRFMLYGTVNTEEKMRAWVADMLERQSRGTDLPFTVILLKTGKAIGATRFLDIRPIDRGLEIGGTWYQVEYQHTAVNTECKYLLLKHAFETLGCIRIQFKTDSRNERSQQAIERLGAVKEGMLRNHMILSDGTIRHSVYYSIIGSEWLSVKANLEEKLAKRYLNTLA